MGRLIMEPGFKWDESEERRRDLQAYESTDTPPEEIPSDTPLGEMPPDAPLEETPSVASPTEGRLIMEPGFRWDAPYGGRGPTGLPTGETPPTTTEPFATSFWEMLEYEWQKGTEEMSDEFPKKDDTLLGKLLGPAISQARTPLKVLGGLRAAYAPLSAAARQIGMTGMRTSLKLGASPEIAAGVGVVGETAALFAIPGAMTARGLRAMKAVLPVISGKYGAQIDELGKFILSKVPPVFRAGGGAPKTVRDMQALADAHAANEMEQAIALGSNLTFPLNMAERARADQLLRGGITAELPAVGPLQTVGQESQRRIGEAVGKAREHIDKLQRELVETGRLSEEIVERFSQYWGPYLPRLYAKDLLEKGTTISIGRLTATKGTPRLMRRGERITVDIPTTGVNKKNIGGNEVQVYAIPERGRSAYMPGGSAENVNLRVDALRDVLAAGFRVEKREGRKITLFRDIPEAIRIAPVGKDVLKTVPVGTKAINLTKDAKTPGQVAGILQEKTKISQRHRDEIMARLDADMAGETLVPNEVIKAIKSVNPTESVLWGRGMGELRTQPGFVVAKAVQQMGREIATHKFFNEIAKNPEWISATERVGFTQMANDVKTLGSLANKYVRADIAGGINDTVQISSDFMRVMERVTNMWKIGKVMNPGTMARNVLSSTMLADFGGLSPFSLAGIRSYSKALRGLLGKDAEAAKWLGEAKRDGLFLSSWNQQEINSLYQGWMKSPDSNALIRALDAVSTWGAKGGELIGKKLVGRGLHPTRWYGGIDHFFKSALYVHQRLHGKDAKIALSFAKKYGIDYKDISPAVRALRKFPLGAPFATFASKAIPLSIETAVKHPVRFWKWPIAFAGIEEISRRQFMEDREEITDIKRMGKVKNPRFVLLPTKDEDGRFQFLDLGYILPFGDLVELWDIASGGGGGAGLSFQVPGGPAAALGEIVFNRNMFTGKEITKDTDTLLESAGKINDHLLKAWLPAWAPPIPFTGFRGGYTTVAFRKALGPGKPLLGEKPLSPTDFFGRQQTLATVIASKVFGLSVKNVSLSDVQRIGGIKFQQALRGLSSEIYSIRRQDLPDETKRNEIDHVNKKIQALMKEYYASMYGPDRDWTTGKELGLPGRRTSLEE
jgi:hypothetical protein